MEHPYINQESPIENVDLSMIEQDHTKVMNTILQTNDIPAYMKQHEGLFYELSSTDNKQFDEIIARKTCNKLSQDLANAAEQSQYEIPLATFDDSGLLGSDPKNDKIPKAQFEIHEQSQSAFN